MAEELRQQVPLMKEMLRAMGVTVIEKEGLEADDLLGTIAKRSEAAGYEVSVVSGDRDLLQLASDHIKIRFQRPGGPERKSKIIIPKRYWKNIRLHHCSLLM